MSALRTHRSGVDGHVRSMGGGGGNAVHRIKSKRNHSKHRKAAKARRLPIVLIDADHFVADLYEAQTTPHVFVIDRDGILRYRGAVDDVTFRQRKPTRFFLDEAVEALLEGHLPDADRGSRIWLHHRSGDLIRAACLRDHQPDSANVQN